MNTNQLIELTIEENKFEYAIENSLYFDEYEQEAFQALIATEPQLEIPDYI